MPLELTSLTKGGAKVEVRLITDQAFIGYVNTLGSPKPDQQKGALSRLHGDFIRAQMAQSGETGKETVDEAFLQEAWNALCSACASQVAPPRQGQNYPLPQAGSQRTTPQSSKKPRDSIPDPVGKEYETWKAASHAGFRSLAAFESYQAEQEAALTEEEWLQVADSVYLLGRKYPLFHEFFAEVQKLRIEVESLTSFTIDIQHVRLRALLRRMVPRPPKYRQPGHIEDYKGACSEILDALRSMRFRHIGEIRISVPVANKTFEATDVAAYLLSAPDNASVRWKPLLEQDIDRTEVRDKKVKYYIEVKSDVHTAVEKHQKTTDQLDRILAVINNRNRKSVKMLTRCPAVSILNPDGWLELFTSNTARNYYTRGFWLFIDNQFISPDKIREIDRTVWEKALSSQPYVERPSIEQLRALEVYFRKENGQFERPARMLS